MIGLIAVAAIIGMTYRHNIQLRAEVKRTEAGRNAAEASRNYQEARKPFRRCSPGLTTAGSPVHRDLSNFGVTCNKTP